MDDKRPVKPSITSESNGDEGYREEQVRENSDARKKPGGPSGGLQSQRVHPSLHHSLTISFRTYRS